MTKSILLSVKPEYAVKILNGDKTLELRKSVPKDFTGWVYIYVIKRKRGLILHDFDKVWRIGNCVGSNENKLVNGLVVARFWFDEKTLLIANSPKRYDYEDYFDANLNLTRETLWRRLNLTKYDISDYGKGKMLYAWHIKQLEIFDEPKELENFYTRHDMLHGLYFERKAYQFEYIKKAPKNWQYVYKEE